MLLSKCAVYNSKISRFIKIQEASGLLSNLRLKTRWSKILLIGGILFWRYKMNEIVINFY